MSAPSKAADATKLTLAVLAALVALLLHVGDLVAWATPFADDWTGGLRDLLRLGLAVLGTPNTALTALDATMLAVALGAFGAGSLTGAVGFPRAARLTSPKHIAATGAALCLLTLAAVTVALIVAPTPGALLG